MNLSYTLIYLARYLSLSIITGGNLRSDLLLKTNNNYLYILELTVGFESNLDTNATRKHSKYASLLSDLQRKFRCVSFVNLSMSSRGPHSLLNIFENPVAIKNSFILLQNLTLSSSINNKNCISSLNFPTLPSVLHSTYFIAKINHGQIRNKIRFNFGSFIFSQFSLTSLPNCKLPCNSENCYCSLS